jgi:hypothetical protein
MVHIDDLMEITLAEWGAASARREEELKEVFRAYDTDGDGNLNLVEFTKIVNDVDAGQAPGLAVQSHFDEPRSSKAVLDMYAHDAWSPAFLPVSHTHCTFTPTGGQPCSDEASARLCATTV